MQTKSKISANQSRLQQKYKRLMEHAYNLRQTDSAQSDISEYKAIKLLNKLNRLKYLYRDPDLTNSVA